METVTAYEGKTHSYQLLRRVADGEQITITRHGVPVARMIPTEEAGRQEQIRAAIVEMREFRKGQTLGGLTIRELIDEGRR
jgi:prevent-host-death family protein